MKKVGIITVHRLPNWGSAMQGFALRYVIQNMGYDCECIDYIYPNPWHIKRGSWIPVRKSVKYKILRLLGLCAPRLDELIDCFVRNELKVSRRYSSFEELHSNPPLYDIYVSGSDQIWNWKTMCADPSYLLDFAPKGRAKIAYSSSFSVDEIPPRYIDLYKSNLSQFSAISVRENNGKALIKALLDIDVPVVLDPTLLIVGTKWKNLANKARWKKEMPSNYILCYVLDYTFNPRPAMVSLLHKVQEECHYPVVLLGRDLKEFTGSVWSFEKTQGIGVYEFLWLVEHASLVVTSSFHGTAFSVNIGTPFISMIEKEEQSDDRIISFLKMVHLESHVVTINDNNFDGLVERSKFNFPKAKRILDESREKSLSYLKNALSGSK